MMLNCRVTLMSMNSHWGVGSATTPLQKELEVHGRLVLVEEAKWYLLK